MDTVSSWTDNLSVTDRNLQRAGNADKDWYARVRARPDIIAEVGTTKFVLGLELDETFGQTGNAGAIGSCGDTAGHPPPLWQCSRPPPVRASPGRALGTGHPRRAAEPGGLP